jgi:uncharacterized membrane-anchored protein
MHNVRIIDPHKQTRPQKMTDQDKAIMSETLLMLSTHYAKSYAKQAKESGKVVTKENVDASIMAAWPEISKQALELFNETKKQLAA